jgi:DNA-binding MarR family transcriptional regulator
MKRAQIQGHLAYLVRLVIADRTFMSVLNIIIMRRSTSLDNIPGFLFRRLRQVAASMFFKRVGHLGITPEQYTILRIAEAEPGIEQVAVAARALLDASTTTDVLRRLEGKRYIKRKAGRRDKRTRLVYLTAKGLALLDRVEVGFESGQDDLLTPLAPEEREILIQLVRRVVEAHEHAATDRPMPWRRHTADD